MLKIFSLALILVSVAGASVAHASCESPEFTNDVLNDLRILPEFATPETEIIQIRAPKTIIYNESYDQYRCRYTIDLKSGVSKEISIEYKSDKTGGLLFSYEYL